MTVPSLSGRSPLRSGDTAGWIGRTSGGHDLDRVLHIDDLVRGDVFFVATGITDGELLRGVQYRSGGATTQSLVMRSKSGTIRSIESLHSLEKLRAYSSVPPFDQPAD